MRRKFFLCALLFALASASARADALDARVRQLVVSIAPDWNSMTGKMQRFERGEDGAWKPVSEPVPVLFGKNGLAWGRGVKGQDEAGLKKVERDKRAPAGIFEIGKIYTYDAKLPDGSDYPFRQVTDADVWSDDPRSPDYNRHVVIDPKNPPDNFSHERMRPGDFAYHWIIEIKHNENPAVPGAGSAIFFHTRRGVAYPTSGCTTMAVENLTALIRWLRAPKHPNYVLLPWSEYRQKWQAWGLPSPVAAREIVPGK
jgi:L,D-peptidoglycan transpeptidase YkuD (ErfK/YbiS/YcfS/YnhG family)